MKKDTYATPQAVFDYFNREFNFDVDVCAEDHTAKCSTYYTIEADAFLQHWHKDGSTCWCNPPYSNITPWISKAIDESKKGVTTVMFVMCDPSVGWFKKALAKCSEVRFIVGGRVSFEMDGQPVNGNNKGSMAIIFRPHNHSAHVSFLDRSEII